MRHAALASAAFIASRMRCRVCILGSRPSLSWKTKSGSPANCLPKFVGVMFRSAMKVSTVVLKASISDTFTIPNRTITIKIGTFLFASCQFLCQ